MDVERKKTTWSSRRGYRFILQIFGLVAVLLVCSVFIYKHLYGATHARVAVHASAKAPRLIAEYSRVQASSDTVSGLGGVPQISHKPVTPVVPVHGLRANILMYHHVGPLPESADALRRDLTVSPENFESQVAWLKNQGYVAVTLEQVYEAGQNQFAMPKKPVVFTFDDGYADVFSYAVPILQKYGMRGSFAIVPGFLGKPDYASWAQVEAAHAAGMEVVSHTETHFDGSSPKFTTAFIKTNLEQSLTELDAHLGKIPRILVYPYGHYTPEYIAVAKELGFTMGLTTHFGYYVDLDDPMLIPRVRVHGGEPMERFQEILTGKKLASSKK